uniref:Cytochrome P450 n=1 Tax=Psilocybe cubensis TaxID=181762 RepID=A0A8H8CKE8_PSICU
MSTDEPGHVKAILSSQFESFEKGPMLYSQLESFFGTGVFNADGEMWKSVSLQLFLNETMFTPIIRFHRAMTRPFFTKDRISHFDLFARTCDMSLATAKNRLSEGYSIDIQDLVSRFTLDSSTEFLFGGSVGSILGGLPYPPSSSRENPPEFYNHPSTTFVDAFTKGMGYTALRLIRGNQWPLSEFWKDVVAPLREIMDQFTEPLMQAALNKRGREEMIGTSEIKETMDDETLIGYLVKNTQGLQGPIL